MNQLQLNINLIGENDFENKLELFCPTGNVFKYNYCVNINVSTTFKL